MAVMVDELREYPHVRLPFKHWCHLVSDGGFEELHAFAAQLGIPTREEQLNRYDVYTADEVFLTGTASEIVSVRSVDGRVIGATLPGPVTGRLQAAFHELVKRESAS